MGLAIVPSDWTEEDGYIEWCIKWPNSFTWAAILRGLLTLPCDPNYYDPHTGDPLDALIAMVDTLDQNLSLEECMKIPVGTIVPFVSDTIPDGWLLCNGQDVSRTTYAELFALIGITFGSGDTSTTFNVPQMLSRVPVGKWAGNSQLDAIGKFGGSIEHTLTTAQIPAHSHTQDSHNHTQNSHNHTQNSHNHTQNAHNHFATFGAVADIGTARSIITDVANSQQAVGNTTATNQAATATNQAATATNQAATATNQNTGGGEAHNNLQPFLVLNYIIKY